MIDFCFVSLLVCQFFALLIVRFGKLLSYADKRIVNIMKVYIIIIIIIIMI